MNQEDQRSITDEDRRLAESKKLTLNPIHQNITPDSISDEQITREHLTGSAIANAPNDTEQNTRPIIPSKSAGSTDTRNDIRRSISTNIFILIALGVVITTGIIFFL